jgi:ankyrin repeat protein
MIHPRKRFTFVASNEAAKNEVLGALTMAIALSSISKHRHYIRGWQYQYGLGTIFQCALSGNVDGIEYIASRNSQATLETDINGWSGLFYAAIRNNSKCIHVLCLHGADLNLVDSFGLSALHYACIYQCPASVKTLIEMGADVHLKDSLGRTPLFLCSINEDPIIHEHIPWDGRKARMCFTLLQAAGADVNSVDGEGLTALEHHICVSADKCRLLLECGAIIDSVYHNENSILHLACDIRVTKVHSVIVGLLLQNGAQPNACNQDGNTPLHLVLEQYEVVKSSQETNHHVCLTVELLLSHGARMNILNKKNTTAEQLMLTLNLPCKVKESLLIWKLKKLILPSARILHKGEQSRQKRLKFDIKSQSFCRICKLHCNLKSDLYASGERKATIDNNEALIACCGICFEPVCENCSTKQVGMNVSDTAVQSQYDLPPSLRTKSVCDGCYNEAFYDIERESQKSQTTSSLCELDSIQRPRRHSLHALRTVA